MPPKKKNANKKADQKKKDKIIEDKTFGLKNKNKSKKVQGFIKNVQNNVQSSSGKNAEQMKAEKKAAKVAKMQADEELRALFNEALDGSGGLKKQKTKKDKQKEQAASIRKEERDKDTLMKDYPFIADEMLAMTGMLNDMEPEELDEQLAIFKKTGKSEKLTLEQIIELERAKMRAEGRIGTPVTEESLARWKSDREERRRLANIAKVEAEMKKKKGGKGLSVLSGKDLFAYNQSLFVDDEEADDEKYERSSDVGEEEAEENRDAGAAAAKREEQLEAAAEVIVENSAGEAVTVALQESLYLDGDDDDLDGLDDLSDLDSD
uniref:ZC3H15/TMA46 family C-terminal domain-containing protein n=1 Tax=Octactis speculum TaxID=3111310 RepID=A0A7S2BQG9_9STRA|mmetsp:Transcript_25934/g.35688  ORF Transcript_25934/g.35688 Transcript_25934/m.35688 type:complete len:321 (+) Transcript_25934:72-1034(+)|eukprot:CAMPEP_0185768506 /NCGR_PEP_ID=MMETSP1174-20130828/50100_1 /TAXON_ID=35687 /ORGANISM="Dictyocha speculum, Strain CCMP1381" /LENGTH=320 /DNA_ID=CAMNT_0028453219 /DNA_START=72 /DNA_END=1034 /DNA_ORIENTATION=+